ncbi:hypothetical protein [Streptomyces sp. NPDC001652]|uniref:hypothetical protein n=1 Tax=Streptomyces sp. NPDC001652 TaxID=3154393 RepID=UPI00332C49A8
MPAPEDSFASIHTHPPSLQPPTVPPQLLRASDQLRTRFIRTNAAAALSLATLSWITPRELATRVSGPITLGMLLLTLYVLTLLGASLWYDRACAIHCDPHTATNAEEPR